MRILIAHNAYQHRGGEDAVVEAESALLRTHGHVIALYQRSNQELLAMSRPAAAFSAIWAQQSVRDLEYLCRDFNPDLIHAHNTFPLISPSLYWMAARHNIPVVQTLHNFRLLCPQATLLRDGTICEDCVGRLPWRAVARKCYRNSALQSAILTGMLATHRVLGTYQNKVARYIVPNAFCRGKFIAGGMPADLLRIKPHFVDLHEEPSWDNRTGGIFAGRLSAEKGIDVLIRAAARIDGNAIRVIGSGPLEKEIEACFGSNYLGPQPRHQVLSQMQRAQFLVAPSTCYETFGLAAVEAFACGTPVIASRHGSLGELVSDGITGLLFTPGDARDLADKIKWALVHPQQMLEMGRAARQEYLCKYTPERNYQMLMKIYDEAIAEFHGVPDVA